MFSPKNLVYHVLICGVICKLNVALQPLPGPPSRACPHTSEPLLPSPLCLASLGLTLKGRASTYEAPGPTEVLGEQQQSPSGPAPPASGREDKRYPRSVWKQVHDCRELRDPGNAHPPWGGRRSGPPGRGGLGVEGPPSARPRVSSAGGGSERSQEEAGLEDRGPGQRQDFMLGPRRAWLPGRHPDPHLPILPGTRAGPGRSSANRQGPPCSALGKQNPGRHLRLCSAAAQG